MKIMNRALLLGTTLVMFGMMSCSKTTELGLSLVEQDPLDIFITDTVSLDLTTVETDPSSTTNQSRFICGAMDDPVFGSTTSQVYMNFSISSTNVSFPNSTLDSIVLSLTYDTSGHYGNILDGNLDMQNWEVLRMEEGLDVNGDYNADVSFQVGDVLASGVSFTPNFRDSITVSERGESIKKRAHLRIRLDDNFGTALLDPTDSTIYDNNDNFKEFFKGVCVRPAGGMTNTSLVRFLARDNQTNITMYYTQTIDSAGISVTRKEAFTFITSEDAESAQNFTHDYSSTSLLSNTPMDTAAYMQGMSGVRTRVSFPYLDQLGDIVVNKAELVIYPLDGNDETAPIPQQLFALERLSDGELFLIDDVETSFGSFNSPVLFGGLLDDDDADSIRYTMNISEYLQRIVEDDVDEKALYIQPAAVVDPSRVRIGNQYSYTKNAKLILTYSLLN